MPNKNEPLVLTYDNLVIGGNLEAFLFASTIRLPLIFTWSQPPFYFEEDDHFGNLLKMWEKLYFSMSLSGMIPFGDSVHHINYVDCETLAVFTKEEKKFTVRPRGTMESRRKLFDNGNKYVGKMLTVIYQELTEEGKPRFPVGKDIRENY